MTSVPQSVPSPVFGVRPRRRFAAGDVQHRSPRPSPPPDCQFDRQAEPSAATTDARKTRCPRNRPPLFSIVCALLCEPPRKIRPLFCYSCALLRPQATCFDSHASCPRGFFRAHPHAAPNPLPRLTPSLRAFRAASQVWHRVAEHRKILAAQLI
jgi:hypothetical protein